MFAVQNGYEEMLFLFKKIGIPLTVKIYGCNNQMGISEVFINTLLHIAVKNNQTSIVRFLFEQGADVNALAMYERDEFGMETEMAFSTVLADANSEDIRNLLTAKGALTFTVILQNPSKHRNLIEQWGLPTFVTTQNDKLNLRERSGSKTLPLHYQQRRTPCTEKVKQR